MISLRCSSLDRVAACPASAVAPEVVIDGSDEAAALGSAVHEALSNHIDGLDVDAEAIADRWKVDRVELGRLFYIGRSLWSRIEQFFPDALTDQEFVGVQVGGVVFTGTADVVSVDTETKTVNLLDFKTGWADAGHEQQLRGYAFLALCEMPMVDKVRASVLKLRFGDLETWEWTRAELEQWAADLAAKVESESHVFRPSVAACQYCPRAHECPARRAMFSDAIALIDNVTDHEAEDYGPESALVFRPEQMARAVEFARKLTRWCDCVLDIVKTQVRLAGGEIGIADGRALKLKDVVRTEIDYAAGEDVLRHHLGDALTPLLKVSKSDVEDAIRKKTERGKKKAAVDELLYELDQAAALKLSASPRLELTQVKAIEGATA